MNKEEFQEVLGRIGRVSRTVRRHSHDPSVIEEISDYKEQIDENASGFNSPNNHYGEPALPDHDIGQNNYRSPETPEQQIKSTGMVTSRPAYRNPLMKFSPVKSIHDLTSPKSLFKKTRRVVRRQRYVDIRKLEENLSSFEGLLTHTSMSKILQAANQETSGQPAYKNPLKSLVEPSKTTPHRSFLYRPVSSTMTKMSNKTETPQKATVYSPETRVPYEDLTSVSVGLGVQEQIRTGTPVFRSPLLAQQATGMQTPNNFPFVMQSVPSTQRRVRFEEPFQLSSEFSFDGIEGTSISPDRNMNEFEFERFERFF